MDGSSLSEQYSVIVPASFGGPGEYPVSDYWGRVTDGRTRRGPVRPHQGPLRVDTLSCVRGRSIDMCMRRSNICTLANIRLRPVGPCRRSCFGTGYWVSWGSIDTRWWISCI